MSRLIKVLTLTLVVITVLLVSVTGTVLANGRIEGEDFAIEVSPNILNTDSYGNSGNIHSNIPVAIYGEDDELLKVQVDTLAVNGEVIWCGTGVDDCGHLVLNFDMEQVKGILVAENSAVANFVLTCFYVEGDSIIVEDSVPVISVPQQLSE